MFTQKQNKKQNDYLHWAHNLLDRKKTRDNKLKLGFVHLISLQWMIGQLLSHWMNVRCWMVQYYHHSSITFVQSTVVGLLICLRRIDVLIAISGRVLTDRYSKPPTKFWNFSLFGRLSSSSFCCRYPVFNGIRDPLASASPNGVTNILM